MVKGKHVDPQVREARVMARQRIGKLRDAKIQQATLRRYWAQTYLFCQFVMSLGWQAAATWDILDWQLQEYIEYMWEFGFSVNDAQDTCSGTQHFLRTRRRIPGAWKLIGVWRTFELPERAPPMLPIVMTAMLGYCVSAQWYGMCATLLVGWHGFLRTTEMTSLKASQIRVGKDWKGVINLGLTQIGARRGANEMITVTEAAVGLLLSVAARRVPFEEPLMGCGAMKFRAVFGFLCQILDIEFMGLRPYSIRRGAATEFFVGTQDVGATLFRGRWSDIRTAKIYVTDGAAALTKLQVSELQDSKLRYHSGVFRTFLQSFDVNPPAGLFQDL